MVHNLSERPRGRPRSFDTETALKAASERFRTRGFAGTSLDDLAEATGLARPSLYAAFGDKRALYLATLSRLHQRLDGLFDGITAARLPRDTLLETIFARTIDGYLTGEVAPSGCLAVATATTEAAADPDIRDALLGIITLQDERMATLFTTAGIANPEPAARIVMSVLHSLGVRARAGVPRDELDRIAAECIAMIL
ncbi:MAG: TetR/AcrR family transcriptional regulator [Sphingomonas sp.]